MGSPVGHAPFAEWRTSHICGQVGESGWPTLYGKSTECTDHPIQNRSPQNRLRTRERLPRLSPTKRCRWYYVGGRVIRSQLSWSLRSRSPSLQLPCQAGRLAVPRRQRYPLVGPRVRKRGRPPTPAALIPAEAVKRLGGAVWGDRSPVAVWSPAPLGSVDRWPLAIIEKQIPGGSRPAVAAVRRRVRRVWSPHPRAVCRRPVPALWGGHDGNNLACGPDPEGFQWGQLDGRMCTAGAPVVSL